MYRGAGNIHSPFIDQRVPLPMNKPSTFERIMSWFKPTSVASPDLTLSAQRMASAWNMVNTSSLTPASAIVDSMAPPAIKAEQFADHHAEVKAETKRQMAAMDSIVAVANGRRDFTKTDLDDLHLAGVEVLYRDNPETQRIEAYFSTVEKFEPEEFDGIADIRNSPDRL